MHISHLILLKGNWIWTTQPEKNVSVNTPFKIIIYCESSGAQGSLTIFHDTEPLHEYIHMYLEMVYSQMAEKELTLSHRL